MTVTETFFSLEVGDMARAIRFYQEALGGEVLFTTERWTSLQIAGVRIGLFLHPSRRPGRVGLHFVVGDLEAARGVIERAGGVMAGQPLEVAPGVVIAEATDPEGNTFTLRA